MVSEIELWMEGREFEPEPELEPVFAFAFVLSAIIGVPMTALVLKTITVTNVAAMMAVALVAISAQTQAGIGDLDEDNTFADIRGGSGGALAKPVNARAGANEWASVGAAARAWAAMARMSMRPEFSLRAEAVPALLVWTSGVMEGRASR